MTKFETLSASVSHLLSSSKEAFTRGVGGKGRSLLSLDERFRSRGAGAMKVLAELTSFSSLDFPL